jgi:Leucine-rich repeat (LRR) protein
LVPQTLKAHYRIRIKNNFLIAGLICLIVFIFSDKIQAQVLLDNEELEAARTFFNLQDALAQPDSVFKLSLKGKKLKEFPTAVYALHNLQVLNLSRNQIKEIPADVHKLKNLQELDMSNNKLSQIPPEIGMLKNLVKLKLNRNVITSIPEEAGELANLEILEMWDNELDTIPDEMQKLLHLKTFELRGILFSDEEQKRIHSLLPETKVYFSPSCACKQ